MSEKKETPEQILERRIAAAKKKREMTAEAERLPKLEQQATDMEIVADLEAEHGTERVIVIPLSGWVASRGMVTMVAALLPEATDHKIKKIQQIASNDKTTGNEKLKASEQLGRQCLVYPSPKEHEAAFAATTELAPGILNRVANDVIKAVQGKVIEEGK